MNLPQFKRDPECRACLLFEGARTVCVPSIHLPGSLPPGPGVDCCVFIGMNPGTTEDIKGIPFIGDSGDILREVYLASYNLPSITSVYLTNAVRCGPKPDFPRSCLSTCYPIHTVPDLKEILSCHSSPTTPSTPSPPTSSCAGQSATSFSTTPTKALSIGGTTSVSAKRPPTEKESSSPTVQPSSASSLLPSASPPSTLPSPGSTASTQKTAIILLGEKAVIAFSRHHMGRTLSLGQAFALNGTPLSVEGRDVTIFTTFHPAYLFRDGNQIHSVAGHMQLLSDYFRGVMAIPSKPTFIPPRFPQ